MKITRFHPALLLAPLLLLPGCLVTQSGSLEVLNPKQAYGRTVAIVDDVHGENADIEKRLASDLQKALAKRGLEVAGDPSKAEIVIVPTLGRMRERSPQPGASVETVAVEGGEPVAAEEPVAAAPAPEARPFNRYSSAHVLTRTDLVSRRAVPSARTPPSAQQAGLLLTGYRGEDFRDYGTGRQSLPPVWRIYVSQPAVQMKWNSVAVPLISAAAAAAKPLGKSKEQGAGGTESEEEKKKAPEPREKKKDQKTEDQEARSQANATGRRGNGAAGQQDVEPEKKRKFLGLFGGSSEQTE